jgi:hypothetical protein
MWRKIIHSKKKILLIILVSVGLLMTLSYSSSSRADIRGAQADELDQTIRQIDTDAIKAQSNLETTALDQDIEHVQ